MQAEMQRAICKVIATKSQLEARCGYHMPVYEQNKVVGNGSFTTV